MVKFLIPYSATKNYSAAANIYCLDPVIDNILFLDADPNADPLSDVELQPQTLSHASYLLTTTTLSPQRKDANRPADSGVLTQ